MTSAPPDDPSQEPATHIDHTAGVEHGATLERVEPPAHPDTILETDGVPTRIGQYRILGIVGEGGMGTVYEAQQDRPSRTVALKVIRGGGLSASRLRRFEHESQVLGRLQHPGIAQIYEAGTVKDDQGRMLSLIHISEPTRPY